MKRALLCLSIVVVGSLLAGQLPEAYATVNGGPWDVSVYSFNTCAAFSSGICNSNSNGFGPRGVAWISVDSDDYTAYNDASPLYNACIKTTARTGGTVNYSSQPFKKSPGSSGGATWSTPPLSGYLGYVFYGALFSGNHDINDIRVITNGTTCDATAMGGSPGGNVKTLRAYSGSTYSPLITHIRNDGDALNTSGSAPFFASTDTVSTNPPTIAQSGGSVTQYSLPTEAPTVKPSAGNNSWSATIAVNPNPSSSRANETYAYDIDWGDGSGHATTSSAQHFYANGNQATATVKLTSTLTGGSSYTDNTTTHLVTQTVTVCWLAACTPTTTTTIAPTGDNGTGSGDCDFWDVPCQLAKIFRALFVPSSSTLTGMSNLWGDLTTKAPFSVLYEMVTFIPAQLADMSSSISSPISGPGNGCASNQFYVNGNNVKVCADAVGSTPQRYVIGRPSLNGSDQGSSPYPHVVREVLLLLMGLLFGYACYRGVGEILK